MSKYDEQPVERDDSVATTDENIKDSVADSSTGSGSELGRIADDAGDDHAETGGVPVIDATGICGLLFAKSVVIETVPPALFRGMGASAPLPIVAPRRMAPGYRMSVGEPSISRVMLLDIRNLTASRRIS